MATKRINSIPESRKSRAKAGEGMRYYLDVVLNYDGDECLPWPFGRTANGYGELWFEKRVAHVHRLVIGQ